MSCIRSDFWMRGQVTINLAGPVAGSRRLAPGGEPGKKELIVDYWVKEFEMAAFFSEKQMMFRQL